MSIIAAVLGAIEVAQAAQPGVTQLVMAIKRPSGELDVVGTLDIAEERAIKNLQKDQAAIEELEKKVALEETP